VAYRNICSASHGFQISLPQHSTDVEILRRSWTFGTTEKPYCTCRHCVWCWKWRHWCCSICVKLCTGTYTWSFAQRNNFDHI